MSGLHLGEHVHLSRIAEHRVGPADLDSKTNTKQVRRLLKNEAIEPQALQRPLAEQLLGTAAASQERIRILMDTVELSDRRQILMAGLARDRRRALPLFVDRIFRSVPVAIMGDSRHRAFCQRQERPTG